MSIMSIMSITEHMRDKKGSKTLACDSLALPSTLDEKQMDKEFQRSISWWEKKPDDDSARQAHQEKLQKLEQHILQLNGHHAHQRGLAGAACRMSLMTMHSSRV
eukprot:TRINITY_DN38729_c0_g1_i1.p2 TRINITY_DN38729_c0_g1~~TRINITY_DN38729_c0_g1_i1.p2  ORF type:complete len:104 (+),score=22.29 TRINITY_DN38729_c0_g1_i1:76-387(+)